MIFGCPGSQKFKNPQPESLNCPRCGDEVEIWTDEAEVRCLKCGALVTRKDGQSCLDWCKQARECVGEDTYRKYIMNKKKNKFTADS